jgi:hypothetical protein
LAFSASVNRPVDSMTMSTFSAFQGSSAGVLALTTRISQVAYSSVSALRSALDGVYLSADNPTAAQGLANGYFDALEMIKADPKKSFTIMGADVKQTAEQFEGSQKFLRWQDRAANQKFFAGEHAQFSKEAADLLLEAGIIRQIPDLSKLADTRFIR